MRPPGAAVSKATLGKVRRMLVERLTPEALNPFARTPENEALVRSTLAAICAEPDLDLGINPGFIAEIEAAICGLGPLQPLVDDPEVADILVNAPDSVFVERAGRLQPTEVRLADARELIELAERIAALAGRELSVAHPVVDARMPDGSRVNAVIPPVGGPYLSIRKFNRLRLDLVAGGPHGRSWVESGGMSAEAADFLIGMVRARANFLVAGETGAGKTTLLRSLTDAFGPDERVGVVEDTAELALDNANRFNLETLHPTDLGRAEADSRLLDVGDLVANALRMRPDRLIVGEIRLPKEAFYTLQALHTGHDGSATTIHASSAEDALFRLELLARQSMRDLSGPDLRAYIARVNAQRPRGRYAYRLTDGCRTELEALVWGETRPRRQPRGADRSIVHHLAVHDLLASFLRAARPELGLLAWLPERICAALFDGYLRPDAVAALRLGDRLVLLFIERDTGSERLALLAAKARRYRAVLGPRPELRPAHLVFVTDSARRARSILSSSRVSAPDLSPRLWAAAPRAVERDPWTVAWQSADRSAASLTDFDGHATISNSATLDSGCLLDPDQAEMLDERALDSLPMLDHFRRRSGL